jgi:nicotinamidase-related amidase
LNRAVLARLSDIGLRCCERLRGDNGIVLKDCTASYVPEFHKAEIKIIEAHGDLFGWVSHPTRLLGMLTSNSVL